ncbi:MAG: hypothetical protein ACXVTC_03345 [Solirubrobacteraceae bacterium]
MFDLYQRLTCPLLAIRAIAQVPAPPRMPWLAELQHAHQTDLNERFARFTAGRPCVRVDRVESTHARILIEPSLPSRIDHFLTAAQRSGTVQPFASRAPAHVCS